MTQRTTQYDKLTKLVKSIENYDYPELENIDIPISHITSFLLEVQDRLDELEIATLKMDSAFRTNSLTGDKTVQAIVKTLLEGRK